MRGCLSSVSFAILVIGNAKGWVKATRGLRQGDPLSPFLFTIVANASSKMMLRAGERSLLEGFSVGRNRTRVSYLQFRNDTIFFSRARVEELQTIKIILLVFRQIFGLNSDLAPLLPTNFVWKSQVPLKVKFFAWLVAHKKVNTNNML